MSKKQKPYWETNAEELAEATKEYDGEFSLFDRPAQTAPEALAQMERAKRKAVRVQVTVERGLLREADDFAKQAGMSRSEMVARGQN